MSEELETVSPVDFPLRQLSCANTTTQDYAVYVRGACKTYGVTGRIQHAINMGTSLIMGNPTPVPCVVLDGLNMTVPKGSIYGLLGASGCGKSTLLNCIVGRNTLDSGKLWVLGGKPGTRGSGVPGPRIGYMPQEIALYEEFTIRETMLYFGWINNLTTEEIDKRLKNLATLLLLPPIDRMVKTLSGGQQRRVSLMAALLHEPELLILDEPTVGVDPVIRHSIWEYFLKIVKEKNTTVIITTHYIDETKDAHLIGLMRGGCLLAEQSPQNLLDRYRSDSLEEIFFMLALKQNMGKHRRSSIATDVVTNAMLPDGQVNKAIVMDGDEISGEFGDNISLASSRGRVSITPDDTDFYIPQQSSSPVENSYKLMSYNHIKTLIWKNILWISRNLEILCFIIGLPIFEMIIFCVAIGHNPQHLPISYSSHELGHNETCNYELACNSTRLSCVFIEYLEKRGLDPKFYDDDQKAIDVVKAGEAWGALIFPANYSEALKQRFENFRFTADDILSGSEISVYMDASNQGISLFVMKDLYFGFIEFFQEYLESCNLSKRLATIPIRFNKPIYGDHIPNFNEFAAPGIILTIVFFLATALATGFLIIERNAGILERTLVNGLTMNDLLIANILSETTFIILQAGVALATIFGIFSLKYVGGMHLIVFLTMLTGLCGLCFGFTIAIVCDTERTATYLGLGSFLPIVILCGIVWPVEGMHPYLKDLALFLPLTKTVESLRSIIARGWGMEKPEVYMGFVSITVWLAIFIIFSHVTIKYKKS